MKLQKLFADEKFSAAMEVSDVGTLDPQSSGNSSNVEGSEGSTLKGSIHREPLEGEEEKKESIPTGSGSAEEEKTTTIN